MYIDEQDNNQPNLSPPDLTWAPTPITPTLQWAEKMSAQMASRIPKRRRGSDLWIPIQVIANVTLAVHDVWFGRLCSR
jgi:hypothetical protein